METYLIGGCLVAVVWLIVWAERNHDAPTRHWWPFDMPGFLPRKPSKAISSWRDVRDEQRQHARRPE